MTVLDLIEQGIAKIGFGKAGAVDPTLYALALQFLNRVYETVWQAYPWRQEKMCNVTITTSTADLIFPEEVESLLSLRSADDTLFPLDEMIISKFDPASWDDESSAPNNFFNLADSAVTSQPASASAIDLVSASADDDGSSYVVRITGTVSDLRDFEEVELDGITTASTTKSFSDIQSITKPLTTGRVTASISGTSIASLAPWDYKTAYRHIQVYPEPSEAQTLYFHGLRRFERLVSDNDSVRLKKAENAIFSLMLAELYEYAKRPDLAAGERMKAADELEIASKREEDEEDIRSFPAWGMFGNATANTTDATHKTW